MPDELKQQIEHLERVTANLDPESETDRYPVDLFVELESLKKRLADLFKSGETK
jgi:hypothetical protein